MANRKKVSRKSNSRKSYTNEYKTEALKLADNIGATNAAKELGIQPSQIYAWRSAVAAKSSQSDLQRKLLEENAKLKRQLADKTEEVQILKKASAYFAKNLK